MISLRIEAIEICNCGPWRGNHRIELPSGLGVWIAPNESGKSTLLDMVSAVLWGDPYPEAHWNAAPREPQTAALEFSRQQAGDGGTVGTRYRVTRDFQTHAVLALEWSGNTAGNPARSPREVFRGKHNPRATTAAHRRWPRRLSDIWVSAGAETFRHIAVLQQPLPEEVPGRLIQALIGGAGNATLDEAWERLVERYRQLSLASREAGLSNRNARTPGRLDELRQRHAQLKTELRNADDALTRLEQLRADLAALEEQLAENEKQLEQTEQSLELIGRYRELNRQWQQQAEEARRLQNARTEVEKRRRMIEQIDRESASLPEELRAADNHRLQQWLEHLRDMENRRSQLVDPEQLAVREKHLESEYSDVWNWPDDAASRIEVARRAHQQLQQAQAEQREAAAAVEQHRPAAAVRRRAAVALTSGTAAWLVAAILLGMPLGSLWGTLLGAVLGLATAAGLWWLYRPQYVPAEYAPAQARLETAEAQLNQAQRAYREALAVIPWADSEDFTQLVRQAERREYLKRLRGDLAEQRRRREELAASLAPQRQPEPLARWLERYEGPTQTIAVIQTWQKHRADRLSAQEAIASMLGAFDCQEVSALEERIQLADDRRIGLRREMDQLAGEHALIESLRGKPASEIDTAAGRLQEQAARLRSTRDERRRQRDQIRGELAQAEAVVPLNLAEGELELHRIQDEIARCEKRCEAIRQAAALLRTAAEQFSHKHREEVERAINRYMRLWSQDETRWFAVDSEFGLSMTVSPASGDPQPVSLDALSQGALDQLGLAVRLAVLDRVADDVVLPLLIDDAFLSWDANRRKKLQPLVEKIAAQRQVLLVTHEASFQNWGQPVHVTVTEPN